MDNNFVLLLQQLKTAMVDVLRRAMDTHAERVGDFVVETKESAKRRETDTWIGADIAEAGERGAAEPGEPGPSETPVSGRGDLARSNDPDRPLRVATWNIAGARRTRSDDAFDYDDVDLPYFVEQLQRVAPDVMCIQESEVGPDGSTARDLAARLGYPHVFETEMCPSHIDPTKTLSLAVISKIPFDSTLARRLPTTRLDLKVGGQSVTPYDRYAQVVRVAGIDVVNMHPTPLGFFGHSYEHGEGAAHAEEIGQTIRSLIDGPAVVAADLNTDRPGRVYQDLFDEMNLDPALEPDARTVPGWDGAPDQVYSSRELQATGSGIEPTETDHHLVWSDLSVTDPVLLEQLVRVRQAGGPG